MTSKGLKKIAITRYRVMCTGQDNVEHEEFPNESGGYPYVDGPVCIDKRSTSLGVRSLAVVQLINLIAACSTGTNVDTTVHGRCRVG